MNSSVFSFLSDFVFLLLLFIQIPSSLSNDDLFTDCRKEFVCGNISAFFPFWGNGRPSACGIHELELKCDHENNITTMNINQVAYRVLEIKNEIKTLSIAREDYSVGLCKRHFMNSTFNPKIFEPGEGYRNFTYIYGCEDVPKTRPVPRAFTCRTDDVDGQTVYIQEGDNGPGECNGSFFVPVSIRDFPPDGNMSALEEQLKKGFEVRWKVDNECWECFTSSGVCGFDNVANQTTCYYPGMHSPPEISL
ncbi:hypothetical protein OIU79_002166 [Salix purpurea]|uniref:non-specific serine/threonine protein kinase n=1 Tax=Salix purpurea TaxID=77065 RepID=A0A9Q0URJ1_SALPP|nr:hypothetical protein OIU79_002166 [Salix purpurea]